jgi:hypothetical protein
MKEQFAKGHWPILCAPMRFSILSSPNAREAELQRLLDLALIQLRDLPPEKWTPG